MWKAAKKLLAEAGIAKGTKLTHTVGQTANLVPAAQVFQAQLTRIGIDLQLEVLDWPAYIKRQRAMDFTSTNTNFFPKVDPGRRLLPLLPLQGRRQRAVRRLREPGGRQAAGGRRGHGRRRQARRGLSPARPAARRRGAGRHHGPGRRGGRLADAGEGLRAAHHRAPGVSRRRAAERLARSVIDGALTSTCAREAFCRNRWPATGAGAR